MAKYLIKGNYVGAGIKGLMADGGSKRRDAASAAVQSVGGSLDCMYFAFGDTDIYAICDIPDAASATAISLLINSSLHKPVPSPNLTLIAVTAPTRTYPSVRLSASRLWVLPANNGRMPVPVVGSHSQRVHSQ